MHCKRIIPCLDVDQGRVVKGTNFVNLIDAGDPIEVAKFYNNSLADEIVFLDITASSEKRDTIIDLIEKTGKEIFIPLTVGGGINSIDHIRCLLMAGADKVSINSAAINNPNLIFESSKKFGSQCITVAIDVKKNVNKNIYEVFINGGRINTGIEATKWAEDVVRLGAGEILLTSMDCDGMKKGFDNQIIKQISTNVGVPVIASGGAGCVEHFYDTFKIGKADAALAASLFHFKELDILDLKKYLISKDMPMRI